MDTRTSREAFRQAAKLQAGLACLAGVSSAAGVILKLNASQMVRDGLEAASMGFAECGGARLSGRPLIEAAAAAARQSPYRLWWTCTALDFPPTTLGRDETWVSTRDLRDIAVELAGAEPVAA